MTAATPLADYLRWCASAPAEFREGGRVRTRAVVADLVETLFGAPPPAGFLDAFTPRDRTPAEENRLRWVLAACHVLWHPALRGSPLPRTAIERLLVQEMAALASVSGAGVLATQQERREELIRRVLRAGGMRLPGEGEREAVERLGQVDSVERKRLEGEASRREGAERARREAELRKRQAAEAASKANYE
ncbi:MAG: hypothetical protein HUU15_11225 [Candidatus Brocadiae bacterium]|nr:hypothetical protein [Candidatus Brocadiia bacterium]